MSQIYIVRHGNTFDKDNVIRRVGGKTDMPLSCSGREQAKTLAKHFAAIPFARAFASNLKRQTQTAQIILDAQKQGGQLETLEFLTEIDYGPDENKPEDQVIARIGQSALQAWDEYAVPPQGWHVDPKAITQNWAQFFERCKSSQSPVLIVTSNGIARFILDVAQHGLQTPRKLRTGAYGIVELQNGQPRILSWDKRPI